MIKFWKNAAKGRFSFPVRPPEHSSDETKLPYLETINESEEPLNVFENKSRLSPSLADVLNNKKSLKYFVNFMQSLGRLVLIKCWIELENFRLAVIDTQFSDNRKTQQLSRTKSFDLDWNTQSKHNDMTEKKNYMFYNRSKSKKQGTSQSCHNLVDLDHDLDSLIYERSDFESNNATDTAVHLFKKYIALEAHQCLEVPEDVRKVIISNICNPSGQVNEDCFKEVTDFLFKEMDNVYFEEYKNSPFFIQTQIDILTSGTLCLSDVLYNENILFYFTEYLEQECRSLLLEFLLAVMHFRDNLLNSDTDPQQAQEDAIVIYDKYISLQATSSVGLTTEVRLNIESEICREGGPLHSCFDSGYRIIFKALTEHLKYFLESEIYIKYLTEMIQSANQTWMSHRRTQSDCSSEYSISTQNTLLAMGDTGFQKKKRNLSVPDMTIDSNQLYNADALWQRKRNDGLSLGRINSLGRFESKFEPDPDRKDRSVLEKMVRRFVPNRHNEVEEEMAWQIAHMIVKDITDLTMAPPTNDPDNI